MQLKKEVYNEEFWRELGVSIDPIYELSEADATKNIEVLVKKEKNQVLKELLELYGVKFDKEQEFKVLVERIKALAPSEKKELLILREFQKRRKATIHKYYKEYFATPKYELSTLTMLVHLLKDSVTHIVSIHILYLWGSKASGKIYTTDKKIPFSKLEKIPNDYKTTLVNKLHKDSGKEKKFKVVNSAKINEEEVIILIYKQVNDLPKPDYDKAIRNKEVTSIMISLKTNSSTTTIEIKCTSIQDEKSLLGYVEENFDRLTEPIKSEVFKRYDKDKVISAFITGEPTKPSSEDLLVNKIVFRNSPVRNSPKLTFELENLDIWDSVKYAHLNNCVNLESIKDIESLSLKVDGIKRNVRSMVRDNGNIIFTMDDSRMDETKKDKIKKSFFNRFGLPLYQEISNELFDVGKADIVDYVMGLTEQTQFNNMYKNTYGQLLQEKLIEEEQINSYYCKLCHKDFTIDKPEIHSDECECGNDKLITKQTKQSKVSMKNVKIFIKKSLEQISDKWTVLDSESNVTIEDEKLKFIKLSNKLTEEIIHIYLSDTAISPRVKSKLIRMVLPTVIITVGQQESILDNYNRDCLIGINFGRIFTSENISELYSQVINTLSIRYKSYIASAASKAYESILSLPPKPSDIPSSYTNTDLEDDVYAIIKDLFPNSEKWGKELSGKEVPEGVFTTSYKKDDLDETEISRVFSYDCKLTRQDEGYNLNIGEKRKGFAYIKKLNNSKLIQSFSNYHKQLYSHIFISNKFQEGAIKNIQSYFYKETETDGYKTKICFITSQDLIYLHSYYLKNVEKINSRLNFYSEQMIKLFNKEIITESIINEIFEELLDDDNVVVPKKLNTKKLTKQMKQS
ncbi:hypothetical protein [Priestia flexa]|uniref:hypothetical protein n=1 Tax=Priestia flexa TaxID=86664 RepID=UPI00288EA2FE|nr:hypothetical protein [Priestia flexa]MDT2048030.1 hypothetical protein [Priestia flexa]